MQAGASSCGSCNTNVSAYVAIGTDLEGKKEVLGIWLGATERAKYWLNVLTGLKNQGVKDILIASVDGLSGFVDAIHTAFPPDRGTALCDTPD